jgi:PmbA protein
MLDGLQAAERRAMQNGAQGVKIHIRSSEMATAAFETGALKRCDGKQELTCTVNVIKDGRRAQVQTNRIDDIDDLVDRAVALAPAGATAHATSYPAASEAVPLLQHDAAVSDWAIEDMVEVGRRVVEPLAANGDEMNVQAEITRRECEEALVTSGGLAETWRHSRWSMGTLAQRTRGTDIGFSAAQRVGSRFDERFQPDTLVREVQLDLDRSQQIVPAKSGRLRAYLAPEIVGQLFAIVQMGLNGRNVAIGDSPLIDRLGERIMDPAITFHDDPHRDWDPSARSRDWDGIATRPCTLIGDGVLERFCYDLDTAAMAGVEPTGHGGCAPTVSCLKPGTASEAELLTAVGDGIYIKMLMGFGQGNVINGDFSCNLGGGYRVQNGEVIGRIKDVMVSGNVYELLRDGVLVGSELDYAGQFLAMVVDGITVSC